MRFEAISKARIMRWIGENSVGRSQQVRVKNVFDPTRDLLAFAEVCGKLLLQNGKKVFMSCD